ncbi:MAG: hypothetical protein A4S09_03275 [Proteobacteria bacterium SG_bin7]|nr:MAG: hypothetical protein A4S09_03275 [Proteobacteria bacterium SG_bin7]
MEKKLTLLLQAGKIREVQSHLEKLEPKKIRREELLGMANIARRSGFHRLAFRLLNPIVRPKNKLSHAKATPAELVEYGIILFRLGVIEESRRVLQLPEVASCPESKLYLAFNYFGEWEYTKSKELLLDYTKNPSISPYDKLIGLVNLGQAYVGLDDPGSAIAVVKDVIPQAKTRNYNLILANALQTYAEALIDQRKFIEAKKLLSEIENVIGSSHYRYDVYLQKNLAVIDLRTTGNTSSIDEVRVTAQAKRLHELVRECDLIRAVNTKDLDLITKVYFGSPYPAYRERLVRHWGDELELNDNYLWDLNSSVSNSSSLVFDVRDGVELSSGKSIKKGTSIHRLLKVFANNMYKTFKMEALFSQVFPNEPLLLVTSGHRVYDTVNRARNWMVENKFDFYIDEAHGEYSLKSNSSYQLKIPKNFDPSSDVRGAHINEMLRLLGGGYFTVNEVMQVLQVSVATANRYLKEATEANLIERTGSGRATKYFSKQKRAV